MTTAIRIGVQLPEEVGERLVAAGATLFTVAANGPDYDLGLARRWVAWRNNRE